MKTAYIRTVPASVLVRPNLSAIGPQMKENPQPTRNSANRIEPYFGMFAGLAAMPDFGSSSFSAGTSTSA